ncbi:MAG: SRPBCC family protein [Chloroflexi bacterium]|nr:SRPBCC family protein [Chloroflexota bacterium]
MTMVSGEIRIDAKQEIVWKVLADLGAVSTWNPSITNSYYTSEAKEGAGASRHCDFPDGGYVNERATQWETGKLVRLYIYEGTVPFDDYYGTYSLSADGDETLVSFALEYNIGPNTSLDPERVDRQNRERLIPSVLNGLKQYIETSPPG